jgi:hypothetical protein
MVFNKKPDALLHQGKSGDTQKCGTYELFELSACGEQIRELGAVARMSVRMSARFGKEEKYEQKIDCR